MADSHPLVEIDQRKVNYKVSGPGCDASVRTGAPDVTQRFHLHFSSDSGQWTLDTRSPADYSRRHVQLIGTWRNANELIVFEALYSPASITTTSKPSCLWIPGSALP